MVEEVLKKTSSQKDKLSKKFLVGTKMFLVCTNRVESPTEYLMDFPGNRKFIILKNPPFMSV